MALTFSQAERAYRDDRITELSSDAGGLRFLLLRSLSRANHLSRLAKNAGVDMTTVPRARRLQHLFESGVSQSQIEATIHTIHAEERAVRAQSEQALVTELYKMQSFDWGGLYRNSLERTIVDNYVKKIASFDQLNKRIDDELLLSMRGYVQCSWYNHWTSVIIEDIFKSHPRVLPVVGNIKKVDFFIDMVPFDLKVTYMPEGYLKDIRTSDGLQPEITLLKEEARRRGIYWDRTLPEAHLLEHLWHRLSDDPDKIARKMIRKLSEYRANVLNECIKEPEPLIRWLYENQGVRRFDASNRLFLVLVNTQDYFASWKLKRNRSLLEREVGRFLKTVQPGSLGRTILFNWDGKQYSTRSDAIFVQHRT